MTHRRVSPLILLLIGWASAAPTIVVSIPPYVDLVKRVAGPEAEVIGLLPAGASPHTFQPTPRDVLTLNRSDLVVLNGGLDEWLHELVDASGSQAKVFEALEVADFPADGSERDIGESPDENEDSPSADYLHAGVNPHIWLDPLRMAALAPDLGEALARVDPENAELYRSNAATLARELEMLDQELIAIVADVKQAPFVPFHDAWPYFAERYDLNLVIEIEPFPGREPSPRYLANALAAIQESGAKAIFNEAQLSDRPAQVLAAEAGVELATLDPLGGAGELQTYDALLRYNALTIARVLGD